MSWRTRIIDDLIPFFDADPRLYLLVLDCGFAAIDGLKKKHPDKVFNTGITEQATIAIATAMALSGLRPIVYGIASFTVFRAYEMHRMAVIQGAPIKVIGTGCGDYFSFLGECHASGETDYIAMETLGYDIYDLAPNLTYASYQKDIKKFMETAKAAYLRV